MISFNRQDFYPSKRKILISEIQHLLKDNISEYNINHDFKVEDISSITKIRKNSIIFIDKNINNINYNHENICIVTNNLNYFNANQNVLLVGDLNEAYNLIINNMFYHDDIQNYPDQFSNQNGSYISRYSKIHDSVNIGKNCVISRGVTIGKNSIIKNNVVIKSSILSDNVIISDNSSIGTSGFGFDFQKRGSTNLNPQIGIVFIDNNVHIGTSCAIDRGKIDITYIGKNSMIDNLVHIAHNVYLSDNACIAAQTGISGSVIIGKNSTIGGQSGFAGHIKIGDNVVIAAKSGVTKNIKDNSVVAGFPAIDIKEWKKMVIRQKKYGYK